MAERHVRYGMYRIFGVGAPNDVRVDDGGISVPVEESLYVARGYKPDFEYLPWEDAYFEKLARDLARPAQ
jgi:hypothetical protein